MSPPAANTPPADRDGRRAETPAAILEALAAIAAGASRNLLLYVLQPEGPPWSVPTLIDSVRGFVIAGPQREALWLFDAVDALPREQAPLVALAQRLPSRVQLRERDPDFAAPAAQAFVVNDTGQLLLFDSGSHSAATFTVAGERARPLAGRFREAWERARVLAELRVLGL